MCFLVQNNSDTLPAPIIQIVEKFQHITDIPCKVHVLDKDASFSCANNYKSSNTSPNNECPLLSNSLDVQELLKFYKLHMRPFILNCNDQYYHWLILKDAPDADYLFVCGPIQIEKNHADLFENIKYSPGSSEAAIHPRINRKKLPAYVNLLFNLIEIHMDNPNNADKTDISFIRTEELNHYFEKNKKTDKKFKNITNIAENGAIPFFKDSIQEILQHILNHNLIEALNCWDTIILEIDDVQDSKFAISYAIGTFSLLGQAVHDSIHFFYTPSMFSLYKDFLQTVNSFTDVSEIVTYTRQCVVTLLTDALGNIKNQENNDITKQTMDFISGNYQRPDLSIEHISDSLNVSQSYMCRTFKKDNGLTIRHYLTLYRLTKAVELLLETEDPVSDIAEQTGFITTQAFRKAFRKYYNMSPTQYKNICDGVKKWTC